MRFDYEQCNSRRDFLSCHTDNLLQVDVLFVGHVIDNLFIDGDQIEFSEVIMNGLFVLIGGEYVSLKTIWDEAERQYPAIKAEVEQEQADEEAHEREMSSPEKTGRI